MSCFINAHAQRANKLKIVSADLPSVATINEMAVFKGYIKNISGLNITSKKLEVSYYVYTKAVEKNKIKSRFSKEVMLPKETLAPGDSIYFEHPIKITKNIFDINFPTSGASAKTNKNVVIIWPVELKTQVWENAVNPIKHEIDVKGRKEMAADTSRK